MGAAGSKKGHFCDRAFGLRHGIRPVLSCWPRAGASWNSRLATETLSVELVTHVGYLAAVIGELGNAYKRCHDTWPPRTFGAEACCVLP